jgi:hypothetical protein
VKQTNLIGALFLENNLTSHVFTPARIAVPEMLASQAAVSLENARLYNDLREREARIRRTRSPSGSQNVCIIVGGQLGVSTDDSEAAAFIKGNVLWIRAFEICSIPQQIPNLVLGIPSILPVRGVSWPWEVTSCLVYRLLSDNHAQQADQRDQWRGRRANLDEPVSYADR